MKKDFEDDTLREVLQSLPRARPRDGFRERLLARVDAEESRSADRLPLRWLLAGATVVLLAMALSIFFVQSERPALSPSELAEVQRLLEQTRQLEDELAAVRQQLQAAEPVLYLEGLPTGQGGQVDLLVEMPSPMAQPASYRLH